VKLQLNYKGEPLLLSTYNLCHIEGHGDYELFPSKPLVLDLSAIAEKQKKQGWEIQGVDERIYMAKKGTVEVTLFPYGRVIIEQLIPDTDEAALDIVKQILDAED
jgi:hypothetical protein